jgi:hypothetical protein
MTDALDEKTKESMHAAIPLKRLGEPKMSLTWYIFFFRNTAASNGGGDKFNGGLYM